MGKSPGKWIKGLLFGKKKGRELSRSASEKPVRVSSKESTNLLCLDGPLNSKPVPVTITDRTEKTSSEKRESRNQQNGGVDLPGTHHGDGMPAASDPVLENVSDQKGTDQAAAVGQISDTSDQARDSFENINGIIKLQSLVRGHLVRRQAVATLFCVQGIVQLQAIARGHMVRRGNDENVLFKKLSLVTKDAKHKDSCEMSKHFFADTLPNNAFIRELLSSSPTSMPLRLQYGPGEPNSTWDWLHRWSESRVWSSTLKIKETCDSEPQAIETEPIKPTRNPQRKNAANNHAKSESDKLKHNTKKQSTLLVKAHNPPQDGNEKIKRQPKRSPQLAAELPNEIGDDGEKPKRYPKKSSNSETPKLSEQTTNAPPDKPSKESEAALINHVDENSSLEQLETHLASEEHPKLPSEHLVEDFKDDQISREINGLSRTSSFPSKHDDKEASPEIKKVPSYMATTASSKAKVKAQSSPRFGISAADRNDLITRRHSLPPSIGEKMSSSPRVQRLVQANGGGHKIDRSLSSSRDVADKVIQPDWKR